MTATKKIILVLLLGWTAAQASNEDHQRYINKYKHVAVSEMERTGVPASIKLAQAVLESNAGKSTLARKANNHFGIKCGSKWRGKTMHRKDDDYKNGKLINSCFRSYRHPLESFEDHSNFLRDPKKSKRYGFLFELSPMDYKNWAKGLKKSGYATSKTYDKKLIKLIEQYRLYQYDLMTSSDRVALKKVRKKEHFYINDVKVLLAKENDTPYKIAQKYKVPVSKILEYNEGLDRNHDKLDAGTRVYLQKKRKNYRGRKRYHTVKKEETMYTIAQLYGLKLDKLLKKNRLSTGEEPIPGVRIKLRGGKTKKKPAIKFKKELIPPPPVLIDDYKPLPTHLEEELIADLEITPSSQNSDERADRSEVVLKPVTSGQTLRYHIVKRGETLWGISRKYNTTVDAIKQLNGLSSKIIPTGLKLRVQ